MLPFLHLSDFQVSNFGRTFLRGEEFLTEFQEHTHQIYVVSFVWKCSWKPNDAVTLEKCTEKFLQGNISTQTCRKYYRSGLMKLCFAECFEAELTIPVIKSSSGAVGGKKTSPRITRWTGWWNLKQTQNLNFSGWLRQKHHRDRTLTSTSSSRVSEVIFSFCSIKSFMIRLIWLIKRWNPKFFFKDLLNKKDLNAKIK